MVRVRRTTVVDAPVDAVWRILRDFNGHDRWHPIVERSDLEDGRRTDEIGAVRNFTIRSGERVREVLLTLSDRNHHLRYAIVDSELPLRGLRRGVLPEAGDGRQPDVLVVELAVPDPTRRGGSPGRARREGGLRGGLRRGAGRARAPRRPGRPPGAATRATGTIDAAATGAGRNGRGRVAPGERRGADLPRPRRPPSPATAWPPDRSGAAGAVEGEAMVIARHGGPEVFRAAPVAAPPPGPGEVRVRHTAVGVNYIDVYCRTGYFDLVPPGTAPGLEAAGTVIDVGSGVRHLSAGRRVAYACPPPGAYATVRTMDAALVVPLPDRVDDETAAAVLLKGMSAEFLLHRVHALEAGQVALVFAPAGGVGRLLCQWAAHLGARVIGATSTEAKARPPGRPAPMR